MPRPIRTLESYIHNETLKDLLAAHLYAVCHVNDDEEVLDLTFGEPNADGVRVLSYKIIKNKEAELIIHS